MKEANAYDLGQSVVVAAVFKNQFRALIDPTVVKLTFKDPAGVETTYIFGTDVELVRETAGKYHVEIDGNKVGFWYYRWWSTGSGKAAKESSFRINPTNL